MNISRIALYAGLAVLISALWYMVVNLDKADQIIWKWILFLIGGIALVFISQIPLFTLKSRRVRKSPF